MRRNPSESDWAKIEHYLLIAIARKAPEWVCSVRLAKMSLVRPNLVGPGLRRLIAENKIEVGKVWFNGPCPSTMYRIKEDRNVPDQG